MKACILKHHLLPVFGEMPLDAIKMHPIEVLKASLLAKGLSRKRVTISWPASAKCCATRTKSSCSKSCRGVKLLKAPVQKFDFLTFEELSRLTEAVKIDPERLALVLLRTPGYDRASSSLWSGATWIWLPER